MVTTGGYWPSVWAAVGEELVALRTLTSEAEGAFSGHLARVAERSSGRAGEGGAEAR
ncbi:hypothetical protein [Streptomyces turgidiscabies]|uniref:Uncharacterized protein n=1 Tax=Streptomyces turgidiscabies TaxID=85558 RepID=A0ABU0RNH6_9ACTN|nr:hypothetical protein [Streptomyces turgidiscabies]MDQ0933548.1 hypothetical protein [Streptomyces turgidiscabies]